MTSHSLTVRVGQLEDARAILELWHQARSAHASTADTLQDVERLLSEKPGSLLVADRDGAVIGVLIAAWDGWRGNMYRLAVAPEQRRGGVGIALVRAGERHLRSQGARRITALVAYDDAVATGFWDTAGYPRDKEIGRRVRNV